MPTPRALELAPRIATALRELERAIGEGQFDPATTQRRFVLACSDGDQIASVPRIATALAREMPHAQLHVVSIDQLQASDGLAAGTVDVSLSPVGVPTEGLHTEPLYTDEAVVVLRADHPIRSRRLSREQFNSLRHLDIWLLLGRAGIGNQIASAHFQRHGLFRNIAVIVPSFATAAMVAATTDMAAGMPRRVAEHFAQHLPLRVAEISAPPLRIQLQLVWHARTHEDPGAKMFRALISKAFRTPPARRRK